MSAVRKINTVVFDLGGVVVDWNPRYVFRDLFSDENEMEYFLTHVANSEWNEQQDAGRSFSDAVKILSTQYPKYKTHITAYAERWPEMLKGLIPGTSELIERIAKEKRVQLLALSNWSAETFPIAEARFGILQRFESVLLSGREKLIKPDVRFFKLLETRHGVDPKHAIFIDDVEKNINAAKNLGYYTVHFQSADQLRRELERHGVLNETQPSTR